MSGALAITPISPADTKSQEGEEEEDDDDPPISKTESLNPFDDYDINDDGKIIPTSPSSSASSPPSIFEKTERQSSNQSEVSDPLHSQLHSVASTSPRAPSMQSIYQQYANKPFLEYKDDDEDGGNNGGVDFDETSISLTDVMNFKLH
jgi:hypothetical protein